MGAIQDQTPELGPFMVELRSESFWVSRVGTGGDSAGADMTARILTVPGSDVPALAAALKMGIERGPVRGGAVTAEARWVVTRANGAVSIAGPWALVTLDAYPNEADDYERVAGEVEYAAAPALLEALRNWR